MAYVSPEVTTLYTSIGVCLNAWTRVETEISTLFMVVHSMPWSDFTHPLRAAFESVISFEARLDMIRASVSADKDLSDHYGDHYNSLQNKLRKAYKKRHEIAHFATFGVTSPKGPIIGIKPFFTWASFEEKTGKGPLYTDDIKQRIDSFNGLTVRVEQHCQHVGRLKRLPPEFFARAGDLAHPPLGASGRIPEEP